MTMPRERTRAIIYAQRFLRDLLDPKKTPKVPREIRRQAARVLRHYPESFYLEGLSDAFPDTFGPVEVEDL